MERLIGGNRCNVFVKVMDSHGDDLVQMEQFRYRENAVSILGKGA